MMLGKSIQAAESALTLENHRLKKLEELEATNQSLRSRPNEVSIYLFLMFVNHIIPFAHKPSDSFITLCRTLAALRSKLQGL